MNSANKSTRNELTLPPIVEQKVNNFKKSNSSTRVDSGIAVDDNHGVGWQLSPNASENGTENVITTIEIVENNNNNSLKKNGTSSTLNSYGKSSSIQSKTSVTNNANSSKFQSNKQNKITASLSPANAATNEANYLASIEKLNTLNVNNDEEYFQVNKKTNDTSKNQTSINKQNNTNNSQNFDKLSRQNTITTINHEASPIVSKQNQNGNVALSSNNNAVNLSQQQQQQKPIPKPRRNDKRALSLQRQNTMLPNSENTQFLKENNDKKLLKRESTNLGNSKQINLLANPSRPKTGNQNTKTAVSFNINTVEMETKRNTKLEDLDTSKATHSIKPLVINSEFDLLKYNEDTENVLAALNMLEHDEAAMNDFTMMRIMKWLEDMDGCNNMIQPPSQLAWNNANVNTKRSDQLGDTNRNFNTNEYALSDYDSLDEQIIEYNRVVDKTFHIVHDED